MGCAHVGGIMGICVYPSGDHVPDLTLHKIKSDEMEKAIALPSAATSHYEKPPCQDDETQASVQGANGDVCAPKCDASGQCPTDVPPGTTDQPQCVLQDQSGDKYCALTCILGGCPTGAKCAHMGGIMGICVYPTGDKVPDLTLHKIKSDEADQVKMENTLVI